MVSMSRAAMRLLKTLAMVEWIEDESAGAPLEMKEEEQPPDVVGVPYGAFA
jgi:hypothetical protein